MKTIHADMLEWSQEWCQFKLFCKLKRTGLTEFLIAYPVTFCLFWHVTNSVNQ